MHALMPHKPRYHEDVGRRIHAEWLEGGTRWRRPVIPHASGYIKRSPAGNGPNRARDFSRNRDRYVRHARNRPGAGFEYRTRKQTPLLVPPISRMKRAHHLHAPGQESGNE